MTGGMENKCCVRADCIRDDCGSQEANGAFMTDINALKDASRDELNPNHRERYSHYH